MRTFFLLASFVFVSVQGFTQQLPQYSQYLFNDLILNPAVAGTKPCKMLSLDYRKQWVGFDGSPTTQVLSFQGAFGKRTGLGATLFNDNTPAADMLGIELAYAFHLIRTNAKLLSLGASISGLQHTLDEREFFPDQPGDAALSGAVLKNTEFDAAFGIYYLTTKFFSGLGIKHLLQSKLDLETRSEENKIVRHYFLTAGYNIRLNKQMRLEPSLIIKAIENPKPQFDVTARLVFRERFWLGASYRFTDAVVAHLGVELGKFTIAYGYDYTLSKIRKYTSGSHEIFISYKFCPSSHGNALKGRKGSTNSCPVWYQ